eukprot:TRINITY_DN384_c0_g3_i1.p1 TRINITY_DN384_c0_g3~~TRINITY_DN384_c0_g3_i1.p1  ORF type:complete len:455 (+),score=137.03 TRINITY_DN384_c0_g3_i1:819-2183(+)
MATTASLVAISRTEHALRTARFAKLRPVTHSFELEAFAAGVREEAARLARPHHRKGVPADAALDQQLMRAADREWSLSMDEGQVKDKDKEKRRKRRGREESSLRILPVHSHSVRHSALIAECLQKYCPQRLAIPSGLTPLFSMIMADAPLAEHVLKRYEDEAAFRKGEKAMIERCLMEFGLSGVVDRRLLHLIPPPPAQNRGLSQRRPWRYHDQQLRFHPFFAGAFHALRLGIRVNWLGIPPELYEERQRAKTLAAEWEIKAGLEDFLLTSGVSFGEFFAELVKKKQAQLTPQEVVSDLNMRYVMYDIAQQPVPGTTLLVVPATEYHAAVGWAAAAKWLTPTSVNEALDANLDLVPSFSKATKRPEFLEVERAVHVDTPTHVAPQGDELALTQDPRLARAVGVHNPMLHETLRPSPAIRVLSPLRDGGKGAVFQYEQTTSDGRAAIAQNPDNIL